MQSPQLNSEHMKCCFVPDPLFENTSDPSSQPFASSPECADCQDLTPMVPRLCKKQVATRAKSNRNSLFRNTLRISPLSEILCEGIFAKSVIPIDQLASMREGGYHPLDAMATDHWKLSL